MRLSSTELVLAILSLAVATLATRSGILMAGERFRLSHRVNAALRFAPACALTALIVPEVLYPSGVLDLSRGNPRWLSAVVAVVFLLWRHSMPGGIAVGMAVYALMRLL
jgi:branched-subunit amino acid transport protein